MPGRNELACILVCKFNYHFNLKRDLTGRRICANGCPSMSTAFTEHFDEQIRATIDDPRMFAKVWDCVDKARHPDNTSHIVE